MSEKNVELAMSGDDVSVKHEIIPASIAQDLSKYLVIFSEPHDHDNPKDWSLARKWAVTSVLSAAGFNRILVSTIIAPALSAISSDFHLNSVEEVMCLSSYLLATAFGPLFIAPLSELYGREPVLHLTNVWFLVWNLVCGFAHTKGLLIAARFLAGFGASAVYVLAGGVLGDVWRPEQRGRSLSLYGLLPLLAASVGPIIGGILTQATTWRWIFWSTSIVQGVLMVFSALIFKETYAPIVLAKRARKLRETTGDQEYHTATEKSSSGQTTLWVLRRSLSRPMRLLLTHPIVQIQAITAGFNYGVTYLVISIYANLWKTRYHQSTSVSGIHYISLCVGEILGAVTAGPLMDLTYRRLKTKSGGEGKPEYHLPIMVPMILLMIIGFFIFGWTAQARTYWLAVDIGAAVLSLGSNAAGQVTLAYVIDTYVDHTSSAQAGAQFIRSLTAFGFPLFAPSMYAALGYGWGNTLLAMLTLVFLLPAPVVLWRYGPKMRARAKDSF